LYAIHVIWNTAWRVFGVPNLGYQKIIRDTKIPDAGIPMGHQLKILISRPAYMMRVFRGFPCFLMRTMNDFYQIDHEFEAEI